jgi:putative membrane protein
MNKPLLVGAAIAMMVAFPIGMASAQSVAEKTGVNSALGVTPTTKDFVTEAANSDMLEIDSSKLVLATNDAGVKSFAQKMIDDHTATSKELKKIVADGKIDAPIPATMDKAHQSKLDKLKKEKGADLVKDYKSMQVSAHKDAVSLFQRYAKGGDNAELKTFASKTLPTLQDHLKMAEDLNK